MVLPVDAMAFSNFFRVVMIVFSDMIITSSFHCMRFLDFWQVGTGENVANNDLW